MGMAPSSTIAITPPQLINEYCWHLDSVEEGLACHVKRERLLSDVVNYHVIPRLALGLWEIFTFLISPLRAWVRG